MDFIYNSLNGSLNCTSCMSGSTSRDLRTGIYMESCTWYKCLVWNLESMLSFCMWAPGAPRVPVCILLTALNPNRRPCVCCGRGEKKQKIFAHLVLSIFLTLRKAM